MSGLARIRMGDDLLAGPSNDNVGVVDSVGALWSIGGGAWLVFVVFCCGYFVGGNLFNGQLLLL